uniref:Uncharacterized protein n=1 Tax=Rhizophora mucronata TaxID=61149 RepID=A0A2P2LTU5_RHIMU
MHCFCKGGSDHATWGDKRGRKEAVKTHCAMCLPLSYIPLLCFCFHSNWMNWFHV